MRELIVKWDGECQACGKGLSAGEKAMYEKSTGLFCLGCEPKDSEQIRAFRLAKAERKAGRYEEWAHKREVKANAQLNTHPEMRSDWAFITQPGHIPERARMIASDDRALDSLNKAAKMRGKAESLRNVRVAGDSEKRRQKERDYMDTLISKGSMVNDVVFGNGEVIGVYKKSYRIKFESKAGPGIPFITSRDKSYIRPLGVSQDAKKDGE